MDHDLLQLPLDHIIREAFQVAGAPLAGPREFAMTRPSGPILLVGEKKVSG